jgi:hypothetical protein
VTAARREGWLSGVGRWLSRVGRCLSPMGRWLITGQSGAGIWGGVIPGPHFPGQETERPAVTPGVRER